MARGYNIVHATDRNCVRVVPVMSLPIDTSGKGGYKICPTCNIHHPVKSLHIWLDGDGKAMISKGVLDLLQKRTTAEGGMDGFTLDGHTTKPPPLKLGRGGNRAEVDNENRKQVIYNETTIGKGAA